MVLDCKVFITEDARSGCPTLLCGLRTIISPANLYFPNRRDKFVTAVCSHLIFLFRSSYHPGEPVTLTYTLPALYSSSQEDFVVLNKCPWSTVSPFNPYRWPAADGEDRQRSVSIRIPVSQQQCTVLCYHRRIVPFYDNLMMRLFNFVQPWLCLLKPKLLLVSTRTYIVIPDWVDELLIMYLHRSQISLRIAWPVATSFCMWPASSMFSARVVCSRLTPPTDRLAQCRTWRRIHHSCLLPRYYGCNTLCKKQSASWFSVSQRLHSDALKWK